MLKKFKDFLYYYIRCPVKFWWQRRTRGFDDSELWDLDYRIMKFCIPRIRALAKISHGYPTDIEGDSDPAFEKWKSYLEKMARAMELYIEHSGIFMIENPDGTFKEDLATQQEFEEGWELFKKYFFDLWD